MTLARAWWIVFSRNIGRWPAPFLAAITFYYAWEDRTIGVALWPQVSAQIAFGQTLISAVFVGIAAWIARRERQRGIDELLRTVTASRVTHLAIAWSTTAAWALIPYAASGALVGIIATRSATWGSPDWWPILAGAAVIIAATSLGFALGTLLPYALLPPVWTIGWWYLDGYLPLQHSAAQFFAPRTLYENVNRSVYFEPVPADIDLKQAVWWLGLAAFCFVIVVAVSARSRRAWIPVGMALPALLVPAFVLVQTPTDFSGRTATRTSHDPACVQQLLRICVHPSKEPLLDEVSLILSALITPLLDVPGAPHEAREREAGAIIQPADTLTFPLYDETSTEGSLALSAAFSLVTAPPTPDRPAIPPVLTFPQAVVATWLVEQAGFSRRTSSFWALTREISEITSQTQYDAFMAEFEETLNRFATLDPSVRHEWFVKHYEELRKGSIDSTALP